MTIVREAHFYGDQLVEMKRYIDAAELLGFSAEIRLEESITKHAGHIFKIYVTDPRCRDYGTGVPDSPAPEELQDFVEVRTVGTGEVHRRRC